MKNYFQEIGAWPRSHNIALAYVAGFVLSLLLTLVAYAVVVQHTDSQTVMIATILAAALLQFLVQVYCFLHIGGKGSRDRLFALLSAGGIILILISGSLWIMFSLNGRMMPDSAQMEQYMNDQDGF